MNDWNAQELKRARRYAGTLTLDDENAYVAVYGWCRRTRDLGGLCFIALRDRSGEVQLVVDDSSPASVRAVAQTLKPESVIVAAGAVKRRSEANPNMKTGALEIHVERLELIALAKTPPIYLDDEHEVNELLRLEYRYLDLRRPRLYRNLKMRHTVVTAIRRFMDDEGFLDVETPMLTKSTPEGARDYLVPSRVHPGSFYALPQSPQIFKQLLMVGGIDKYYQIARCFRDEDLRADRQPEFTQLDLEMSFVDQDDVLSLLERLFTHVMKEAAGVVIDEAFPRLTWQACMDRFGSDKPDLRVPLEIVDVTDWAQNSGVSVFESTVKAGGVVRALRVPGAADLSRKTLDGFVRHAVDDGAKGLSTIVWKRDGAIRSPLSKMMSEVTMRTLLDRVEAEAGDALLIAADTYAVTSHVLGRLRLEAADTLGLRGEGYRFLIVTDFPMFEYNEEAGRYQAQHHPFTMPYVEDLPYLTKDPARVRSQAYDVVLNGVELGSGSLRIHDPDVQRQVFSALGFSDEESTRRFGFMLSAFQYGTPPHGGFAFGLDRFVMLLLGETNLREVIAFPKIKDASCPMTKAPGSVDAAQLAELALLSTAPAQDTTDD